MHMRDTGMTLQDMKKYVDLRKQDFPPVEELLDLLLNHKEKVLKKLSLYEKNLEILDRKIEIYRKEKREQKGTDLFERFAEENKGKHF